MIRPFIAAVTLLAAGLAAAAGTGRGRWPASRNTVQLLPATQAFRFFGARRQGDVIRLSWQIAPGYYLYRDRISVTVLAPAGTKLHPRMPAAKTMNEPTIGPVAVYRGALILPLQHVAGKQPAQRLQVRFQGCADIGVCYPPQTRQITVADSE